MPAGPSRTEKRTESRTEQGNHQNRGPLLENRYQGQAGQSRPESRTEQDREQDSAGQRAGRSRTATRTEDPYWRIASRPQRDRSGQGKTEQDRAGQSRTESRTEQDREHALLQHLSRETRILLSPRLGL